MPSALRGFLGWSMVAVLHTFFPAPAPEITFEQRVEAQRSIERVSYGHQIGATFTFEEAVPREVLESKVIGYLKRSAALERFWNAPVTAETLRAEAERIARQTRMPSRLLELYEALGRDSVLIQECLVRPVLVDRLARAHFSSDRSLHAGVRRQAETLRHQLASGALSLDSEEPHRHVIEVSVGDSEGDPGHLYVDPDEFARLRSGVPHALGVIGPVQEERESYVLRAVLEENEDSFHLATYTFPKRTWSEWWSSVEWDLDETAVRAVAAQDAELRLPLSSESPETGLNPLAAPSKPSDSWNNGSLDDPVPPPRKNHTAVWTGTEMILWSGQSPDEDVAGTGERYDPVLDTFSSISTLGAPEPRWYHTAVWTGTRMIVWGGTRNIPFATGGAYNPQTDTWTPISNVGAPQARFLHHAVWTGSQMVVWGGEQRQPLHQQRRPLRSGDRYLATHLESERP